eukprot:CAMPEP_0119388122 /NCGR_PEP_ID=MMETSP1334-20130426/103624_1 /TAXON_ID=127549 /ORGANISM="Calcidiscus leptoporus, Strain RCC1130" /LENGTH=68 /DNA_ID=CAMNT_0007410013 /DNA_START=99 /DNA_END=303 /DNA_ORIENTATION=-
MTLAFRMYSRRWQLAECATATQAQDQAASPAAENSAEADISEWLRSGTGTAAAAKCPSAVISAGLSGS